MAQTEQDKLVMRVALEHALATAASMVVVVALGAWIFSFGLWSFVKCSILFGGVTFAGSFLMKVGELSDEIKREQVRQSVRQNQG